MGSVGDDLKRERELRGISLKEIADSTKINMRFLKALEKDQMDILPGKFFTKGIIRSYAKFIGLDEHSVLNKYYQSLQQQEQSQEEQKKKEKPPTKMPKRFKTLLNVTLLFLALLAFLFILYLLFQKKEPKSTVPPSSSATILHEERSLPPKPKEPSSSEQKIKKLNFNISFEEKTWIKLFVDGEKKLDGIMNPGKKFQVQASKEILLHLGNAGGVSYTINNQKGKILGASGEVVKNIRITTENYQQYLIRKKDSSTTIN
ncbi:helix-turn-helix domain-containing protein [bacterium]|nr:helix-turn-helix domain-containing protein [bacterium]